MRFLITGGNFSNKGAQAMLFVTISELRMRFDNCIIVVETFDDIPNHYRFETIQIWDKEWKALADRKYDIYYRLRKSLKSLFRKKNGIGEYLRFVNDMKKYDAIIDISGFHLSDQWGYEISSTYLDRIEFARRWNIPVFLMPQSFGTFEYERYARRMKLRISKLMKYPQAVYVREEYGVKALNELGISNVIKSLDLVLLSKGINYNDVDLIEHKKKNLDILPDSVAIITNVHIFEQGSENKIISLYKECINVLMQYEKNIYFINHSKEDGELSRKIYMNIEDRDHIFFINEELDCINFEANISKFEYVIASRYHSIVHSYKSGVPAIVFGWADKYIELANSFFQGKRAFDMRYDFEISDVLENVRELCIAYKTESKTIKHKLIELQNTNCYDIISDYFDRD